MAMGFARRIGCRAVQAVFRAGIPCAVYDRTPADPTVSCIEEAAAVYLENDCSAVYRAIAA